jgi:hypothetical protein
MREPDRSGHVATDSQTRVRERASQQAEEVGRRAREGAEQQADSLRTALGRAAFDLVEEQFPEAARERRRRTTGTAFVAGLVVGVALRSLVGGR